jgi:dTDP-glucose pyrophosphorylase
MNLNVVIPMAGQGRRFAEAGYDKPKPFIEVLGKPMVCHVLDNLNIEATKFILLARKKHFEIEKEAVKFITQNYNVEWVLIDKSTDGAACTVLHARGLINNDKPLLIVNSDQVVDMDIRQFICDSDSRNLDGSVLCFEDNDPKWSYAKVDNNGLITTVKEKEVVSEHATAGYYYFAKGKYFVEGALDMIVNNDRTNNEFYVAPVYNWVIKRGGRYGIFSVDQTQMHGMGTADDLNKYIESKTKDTDV